MIQQISVAFIIIVAVAYLMYKFYTRFIKKQTACDSCAFGKTDRKAEYE